MTQVSTTKARRCDCCRLRVHAESPSGWNIPRGDQRRSHASQRHARSSRHSGCAADSQIRKKNDLTVIKYVQPKSPMQPDSKDELVTTTVRDYDLAETSKAMKGLFTGMAFMGFLHLYMGYIPPVSYAGAE